MGRLPDLNDPIAFLREALLLAPNSHPERPRILTDLANTLLDLAKWSNDTWQDKRVVEGIKLLRDALVQAEQEPERRVFQSDELARGLRAQYLLAAARPWTLKDLPVGLLEEAITLHRRAIDAGESDTTDGPTLTCLALTLQDRYAATNSSIDLDEAIVLHRRALTLCRKARDRRATTVCQANLVTALHTRYSETKRIEDIREAIALRHAQYCDPAVRDPRHSYPFNVLQPIFRTRFYEDRTIPLVREDSLPDFHIPEDMSPENLVNRSLDDDPPRTEEEGRLDAEIALHRQTLDAQAGDRWEVLDRLGVALRLRCAASTRPNSEECLHMSSEAMSLHQEALQLLPEGDPAQARLRHDLGLAYYVHYTQVHNMPGMESLLDFAVEELEHALKLRVAPHPDRADTLDALGEALRRRFFRGGKALDLDNAILMHREALVLRGPDDVGRWQSMSNLAEALQARSERVRQPADLDEAIALLESALNMRRTVLADHAELSHRLGLALRAKFGQQHQVADLQRAMELYRTSLAELGRVAPRRPSVLNDLATALRTHYHTTAELGDLSNAIQYHREALTLLPQGHYDRIPCLNSLAEAHLLRSKETGSLADLEQAIELCRLTLQGFHYTDRQNPTRSPILETLGHALVERFLRADEAGDHLQDIQEATDSFQAIAECHTAPLSQRFPAARTWARLADACDDGHGLALQAYRTTIEFLPLLAGVGADVASRRRVLTANTDGLAREAAACAIRQRKYKQAVELLEAGRAVFWSQALQLRTPLDDLASVRPDLADKVRELSRTLERGAFRGASGNEARDGSAGLEREKETAHFSELNADWLDVVEEIQDLPGFSDFLGTESFDSLSAAASRGPVVLLIASGFRAECSALIMPGAQQEPICIPLKGINYRMVETFAYKMRRILETNAYRSAREGRSARLVDPDAPDTEEWMSDLLSTLWTYVAQPVLQKLHITRSDVPPRIWWMSTGPFALLPIHAAGIYDEHSTTTECLSEYVISSYTPTLHNLLGPRSPTPPDPLKVLAVIQPEAIGQPRLPATVVELEALSRYVPRQALTKYGVPGTPANVEQVLTDLPGASIVHFACHGIQHPHNPLESALILEDWLKVSRLMELDMPNARLVFLDACQTAAVDDTLPDEPIHLAATLLFAGFHSAVATLWSIADEDGPIVVDAFYKSLFATSATSQTPYHLRSANAIRDAVQELRSRGRSFMRWVPFVHLGE